METYEQKYKEIVERIKELHAAGNFLTKKQMKIILPQLAESEDEKIKKAIVALIEDLQHYSTNYAGVDPTDMLTYLEKQKEKKPTEWSEDDEIGLEETMWCVNEAVQNAKTESEKQNAKTAENWLKSLPERFNLQPKQEWNEEDEKKRNLLIDILEVNHPNGYFKVNPANTLNMEAIHTEELVAWLKSLRPQPKVEWSEEDRRKLNRIYEILGYAADDKGFLTSKRIIGDKEAIELQDFLKSLCPQPKQEWSEEDEEMFDEVLAGVLLAKNRMNNTGCIGLARRFEKAYKWLKSFNPQPHWKSGKEQMDGLHDIIQKTDVNE